ncbi:toxin of the YeeV-YeeU toxin-antitoxin system, partial [Escherichia coli]|nr:toxin of the YeeV-YeeU toxin-antitoxin system [Escherichia coli]EGE3020160.1 toxin of the YeeV-YeeU toxin-antitoxin system [Escherichia coli]
MVTFIWLFIRHRQRPQPPYNTGYLPFITTCYRELKMNTLPDT